MVSSSTKRSPSPVSMRPNPNPNPNLNPNSRINQEKEGFGVRKSFGGYPFAKCSIISQPKSPAAEYARRSSIGRECGDSFRDHEQKENERDPNSKPVGRVRSPSVSKGAKNFMSPTISAASKINPSPRKKVLGERNEAIRTSASLSDGRFHFFSSNSLEFDGENESKEGLETPSSTNLDFKLNNEVSNIDYEKKVADLSPVVGRTESESDLVVLSPEIPLSNATKYSETLPLSDMPKIVAENDVGLDDSKTTNASPKIAPLDADPCYQPYDPKTNFLSPRPQFLHYKPNPRIGSYITQGIRLEDDLASESVSETENSEDVQSEETSSSVGTSVVEEELPSSELSSPESEQLEDSAEAEIEPRSWFGGKWKLVSLLFVILLGSISFSLYSPGVGNAIYQDKIIAQFYNNPQIAVDVAKENINGLLTYSRVWTAQSVGYLSQLIYKERDVKFSPLPFSNLSGWQEEEFEDFVVKGFELGPLDRKEGGFDSEMGKVDNEIGKYPEFVKHEKFAEESVLIELDEPEKLEESSGILALFDQGVETSEPQNLDQHPVLEDEHSAAEMEENPSLLDEPEDQEFDTTDRVIEASEPEILEVSSVLEDSVIVDGHSAVEMSEQQLLFHEPENPESEHTDEEHDTTAVQYESQSDSKVEDTEVHPQVTTANEPFSGETIVESSERSVSSSAAAISALVVSVGLAATAFMFVKKPKKKTSGVSTPLAAQNVHKEKSTCLPAASIVNSKVHESPYSLSSPVEVDMVGESCPSELSSFQETSSYYNKRDLRGHNEAQSEQRIKRNSKRESLASSSSEYTMTTYGSFTTYSILHDKQRHDEVVTPVRRSSRIRSKVTSP